MFVHDFSLSQGNAIYGRMDILTHCFKLQIVMKGSSSVSYKHKHAYQPVFLTSSNELFFLINTYPNCPSTSPQFRIYYKATKKGIRESLHVVHTSPVSGYIQPVGLLPDKPYGFALDIDSRHRLVLPPGHVVMTSIKYMHLTGTKFCRVYLMLLSESIDGQETLLWKTCHGTNIVAEVYETTLVVHFRVRSLISDRGFKLLFTFHAKTRSPHKLPSGMFNCSVAYYQDFKDHLHCNLEQDCDRREDEGGFCSFSSQACNGSVAVKNKCIHFHGKILCLSSVAV